MNIFSRIHKSMARSREATGKAKAHSVLMTMDKEWVERYGYSHELLRGGIKNWPWRLTPENQPHSNINDMQITKTNIEMATQYGHSQNDSSAEQQKTA